MGNSKTTNAAGHVDPIGDTHCDKEILKLIKTTLNYHSGDHNTFFVFGASVSLLCLSLPALLEHFFRFPGRLGHQEDLSHVVGPLP